MNRKKKYSCKVSKNWPLTWRSQLGQEDVSQFIVRAHKIYIQTPRWSANPFDELARWISEKPMYNQVITLHCFLKSFSTLRIKNRFELLLFNFLLRYDYKFYVFQFIITLYWAPKVLGKSYVQCMVNDGTHFWPLTFYLLFFYINVLSNTFWILLVL